jgi:hypothetical protein
MRFAGTGLAVSGVDGEERIGQECLGRSRLRLDKFYFDLKVT